ncbi:MAG: hypothetical protein C5B57_05800 [Blastocatellia bacterium]|nr:MAG: hypothetical protein C5B57_05800 [Blastocatellia bacterium]
MIVVDASAMTELLLQIELGARVERRLYGKGDHLHAPHLIDVEVLSVLRRLVQAGNVSPGRADEAIEDLSLIRLVRHTSRPRESCVEIAQERHRTTQCTSLLPSHSMLRSSHAIARWAHAPDTPRGFR